MPEFTADDVINAIGDKQLWQFPRGTCAFFIAINDEWGWKGYWREAENGFVPEHFRRDYNYDISKRAGDAGLGPLVGDKLDIAFDGMNIKGFIVQRAIVCMELYNNHRIRRDNFTDLLDGLRSKLEEAGFGSEDLGWNNCGFIKGSGKLLAIDFSHSGS